MARTRAASPDAADPIERIERAATELFIRDGYRGTSYLVIAKALGITHSNVHYYYRTKAALAEAVLNRVAADTLANTTAIWRDPNATLEAKFVRMRDWIFGSYLQFNPDGRGGRPWGLLARFSSEADALTTEMKQRIRATLRRLEADVRHAVADAHQKKELAADAPIDAITLQIVSVLQLTGQLTRYAGGFERVDDLFAATLRTILRAYGSEGSERRRTIAWPAPAPDLTFKEKSA